MTMDIPAWVKPNLRARLLEARRDPKSDPMLGDPGRIQAFEKATDSLVWAFPATAPGPTAHAPRRELVRFRGKTWLMVRRGDFAHLYRDDAAATVTGVGLSEITQV
jgi:hypothetical protein